MNENFINNRLLSLMVLCGGLFFLSPFCANATVADGVYAYERGNYEQARKEWLPYAALGNPNALYNLGQLYRMGRGVEVDFARAEEYYLRAAEKGHIGAQRNIGTLYYFGRLGETDHAKAYHWLSRAAVNGDARSQLMVGTMHYNGETVAKDNIEAYAWIFLAAESGLGNARSTLTKLDGVMTSDAIAKARERAPGLITRHLSPDDVGLMVNHQDSAEAVAPELNTPEVASAIAVDQSKQPVLTPHTSPTESDEPAALPPGDDNFRVQLGSYRKESAAKSAFTMLKNRLPGVIGAKQQKVEFADLGPDKGIFYRLQLGPFDSRAAAQAFCVRLKEYGQGCYVVKSP